MLFIALSYVRQDQVKPLKGGEAMEEVILTVEELEERVAPAGYSGAGS